MQQKMKMIDEHNMIDQGAWKRQGMWTQVSQNVDKLLVLPAISRFPERCRLFSCYL
jgi:hypothetical protein